MWCSTVISSPAEGSPTTEPSLGDRMFKKQEECEDYISETIDAILDDEDSNPELEIPIADDDYHDCKEELDKLKREYMTANNIDKSNNPEFFSVILHDGSSKMISVPAEEEADVRDLEFDVNEELCVTNEKCSNILGLGESETNAEDKKRYEKKFLHCHILLDLIKHKYVVEKKLEETKLKEEGGLSVECTGKRLKMTLPQTMNNLDYSTSPHELFGDMFSGDMTHLTPAEDLQDQTVEEKPHEEHVTLDEEHSKHMKVTASKAAIEKPHIISCVLVIFVLVTAI